MKTILCYFPDADYGDLAAKELKEQGLVTTNIEIDDADLDHDDASLRDFEYFLIPAYAMNYSTTFVFPIFPAIIPYFNDPLQSDHNEHIADQGHTDKVIFCARCRDEDVGHVESIILNHGGFDFKVADQ